MSKIKLFCIPFAGGSSFSFSNWIAELRDEIQVIPVELSGKGTKTGKKYHENFSQALKEAVEIVKEQMVTGEKYGIFGHSMGGLLAYELYYEIRKAGLSLPQYIILSAVDLPERFSCKGIAGKSFREFETYIAQLGGLPLEIQKNSQLKKTVLQTIKKDYEIMETYQYSPPEVSIECSGYVLHGSDDIIIANDQIKQWGKLFRNPVKVITVKGSHFFINESFSTTMEIVKKINTNKI